MSPDEKDTAAAEKAVAEGHGAPPPSINGVDPGSLDKTLEFHDVKDGTPPEVDPDKVRLTITNAQGDKESIVVLYGDLNMLLSAKGHNPAQGPGAPAGEPTVNVGENTERTEGSPELDPVSPGVEPGEGEHDPPAAEEGEAAEPPVEPTPESKPAAEASELPLYVDVTADGSATWSYTPPFTPAGLQTPDGRVLYHWEGDTVGEPAGGAKDGTIGIYADEVVPHAAT